MLLWAYGVLVFLVLLSSLWFGVKLETFISATLRSEYVELQIPRSAALEIELPAAAIPDTKSCNDTITIRIPAGSGAKVYYQRLIGGDLNIRVVGRYGWSYNGVPSPAVSTSGKFVLGRNGKRNDCPTPDHVRLPVYGSMIVGLESGGAEQGPGLPILSGQLHIFTKIIDKVWGGSIRWFPFTSSGLYEAGAIAIGAGSQLFDANVDPDGDASKSMIWHGFIDVDLSAGANTERGMLIEASSSANGVRLVSPVEAVNGSFEIGKQQDVVSISTLETILKDPNLHVFLIFFSLIPGVLRIAEILVKLSVKRAPAKAKGNCE